MRKFFVFLFLLPVASFAEDVRTITLQPFLTMAGSRDFYQILVSFKREMGVNPENPQEFIEQRNYASANGAFAISCEGKTQAGSTVTTASCSFVFDLLKSNEETQVGHGKLFNSMWAKINEEYSPTKFLSASNYLPMLSQEKVHITLPNGNEAAYPKVRMDCEKQSDTNIASTCTFVAIP